MTQGIYQLWDRAIAAELSWDNSLNTIRDDGGNASRELLDECYKHREQLGKLFRGEPLEFDEKSQPETNGSNGTTESQGEVPEDEIPHEELKPDKEPPPPFKPFPTECFPDPLAQFVRDGAAAVGCDESFLALPLLSMCAGAIGNARLLVVKKGWHEPAIIWTAAVGESGSKKSPAQELVLRPVRRRQHKALKDFQKKQAEYEAEKLTYEKELAAWKKAKDGSASPKVPEPPVCKRFWCDDVTVEALAVKLQQQPRGLMLLRDELSGWLGSFDRYSQGKGGDAARWLEMFGGRAMMVDRKTDNQQIYVERAAVSIAGGIQPGVLNKLIGTNHRENGLLARLLLAYPNRQPNRWTESEIDPAIEESLADIVDRLYDLEPVIELDGLRPFYLNFSQGGKREWIGFYNRHAELQSSTTGEVAAALSKLEGYCARFALVLHCVRCAAEDQIADDAEVDALSVQNAIRLTEWFTYETQRVYGVFDESPEDTVRRKLLDLIRRRGGEITPRDLVHASKTNWPDVTAAEVALNQLRDDGLGCWDTVLTAGRPKTVFRLFETATQRKPQNNGKADPFVAV